METPALTPEAPPPLPPHLHESSLPPATHPKQPTQTHPPSPSSPPKTRTMAAGLPHRVPSTTSFFKNSLRPLSPPDSPFNFDGAFDANHAAAPAPAMPLASPPHVDMSTLSRRTSARANAKPSNPFDRALERKAHENPYFPSIAEQERRERWTRGSAALLQTSPPEEEPSVKVQREDREGDVEMMSPIEMEELDFGGSSPAERKSRMKIRLPKGRQDWPESPESMVTPPEEKARPASLEEYTRVMRAHLEEGLKRQPGVDA